MSRARTKAAAGPPGLEAIEIERVEKGSSNLFNAMSTAEIDQYISQQFGRQTVRAAPAEKKIDRDLAFSGHQSGAARLYPQADIVPREMQRKADHLNKSSGRKCVQEYVVSGSSGTADGSERKQSKPPRFKELQVFRNEALAVAAVPSDVEYMDTRQEVRKVEGVKTVDLAFKPRRFYQDQVEEAAMHVDETVLTKLQQHRQRPLKIQAQKEEQICPEIKLARRHAEKLVATPQDSDVVHFIAGRRFANPVDVHEEPDIPTARLLLNGRTVENGPPMPRVCNPASAPAGKQSYNFAHEKSPEIEQLGYCMFSGVDVANMPLRITQLMQ